MKTGVVGLGYVGLPLAVAFREAGHDVTGVDSDTRVVEALAGGRSHIEDVQDESLEAIQVSLHPTIRYHDDFVPELPDHGPRSEWPEEVDRAEVDFRGATRGIEAPNLVRL